MRAGSARVGLLVLACACGLACEGAGGSGSGGRVAVSLSPSPGCFALGVSPFPAGFEIFPDATGRALALQFEPSVSVPLDLRGESPAELDGVPRLGLPDDSDGDGDPEVSEFPLLDGVFLGDPELFDAGLGLLTASGYEEVIVFERDSGSLAEVEITVDAAFAPGDFRHFPAPGTTESRTAISSDACIKPEDPIDANGDNYAAGFPSSVFCDSTVTGSFYSEFTSGAAVAASRLFVSVSNLVGAGTANERYLPGAVLVYDLDLTATPPRVSPNPDTPFVETFAYNPTHVTRVAAGTRELVLVTLSGALSFLRDDPRTPEIEAGTVPVSPAAVEVIDAETLEIVAGTPLLADATLAFERIALHPSGRVGVVGSSSRRSVYVLDLAGLEDLPTSEADFEELPPLLELEVPALAGGPPAATCTGFTAGVAFAHAGDILYVTERCDGTLTRFDVNLPAEGVALDPVDFPLLSSEPLVASLAPENFGEDRRDPGTLRVRPGVPGVDFSGPDLFFLVSQPIAQVCARRERSL